jgi:hypothetical protein
MKIITGLLILLTFTACEFSIDFNSKSPEKTKKELDSLLDIWHQAAGNADFKTYFDLMDKDAVYVGTDASEVWTKQAFMDFAKPYFDKGKAWNFKKIKRHIYLNNSLQTAWFDETLDTWMGVCRGSGVLQYGQDTWRIKHYVLSLCVPNEKMDTVRRIIRRDSL